MNRALFRIKAEYAGAFLALLNDADVEPVAVQESDEGVVGFVLDGPSELQVQMIAKAFRPEWSAAVGIIGGTSPLEGH